MFIFLLACILPYQVLSTINVIDKGLIPLEAKSVGIQFFIDIENESRNTNCQVHSRTKRCCITNSEKEDCNIMQVYSRTGASTVEPRDRATLLYVYPTLFQHDQVGFCDFILNWKCGKNTRNIREVSISFDTNVPSGKVVPDLLLHYVGDKNRQECTYIDEDTLNFCKPANCDYKYSEYRPFYESRFPRCIETLKCSGTISKELPDIVYVPAANLCRNLDRTLTTEDVLEIKKGLVVITYPEATTEIPEAQREFKVEIKSNCSTVSQNLFLLKELILGKLYPTLKIDLSEYRCCMKMALIKIITCAAIAAAAMLACLFCFSCMYCIKKSIEDGSASDTWYWVKSKFKRDVVTREATCCKYKVSRVNQDVKNALLRQVIIRDIPMELRDSMVDICERMDRDIRSKRRYRQEDVVSLGSVEEDTSETSTISDEERERLMK